jgi:low affinity Fe/Cu permease
VSKLINTLNRHSGRAGSEFFERFALRITHWAGSTYAFIGAVMIVVGWLITGPVFGYSETWQLVINTGTTIITFLMVFLIQKTQNKESLAIQLKLNELVAAHHYASNRLVNVEEMTEDELRIIQKYYLRLSELSQTEKNLQQSHSIEEAEQRTKIKNSFSRGKRKRRAPAKKRSD